MDDASPALPPGPTPPPPPPGLTSILAPVPGAPTETGKLAYAPVLDIRNAAGALVDVLTSLLAETNWDPWFADYLRTSGHTADTLAPGVRAFLTGVHTLCADPAAAHSQGLGPIFAATGFLDQPLPVQLACFAKAGKLLLSYLAYARGQAVPETDPFPAQLAALQAELARCCHQLNPGAQAERDHALRIGLGLQILRRYTVTGLELRRRSVNVVLADREDEAPFAAGHPDRHRLQAMGWKTYPEMGCWFYEIAGDDL